MSNCSLLKRLWNVQGLLDSLNATRFPYLNYIDAKLYLRVLGDAAQHFWSGANKEIDGSGSVQIKTTLVAENGTILAAVELSPPEHLAQETACSTCAREPRLDTRISN